MSALQRQNKALLTWPQSVTTGVIWLFPGPSRGNRWAPEQRVGGTRRCSSEWILPGVAVRKETGIQNDSAGLWDFKEQPNVQIAPNLM